MKRFRGWLVGTWSGLGVLGLLLLIALGAGAFGWHRYQTGAKLRAAEDELDRTQPGWRLAELEAARAPVADADNSAPLIARTTQLLGPSWIDAEFQEQFNGLAPERQLNAEQAVSLRWKLDSLRPALDEARKVADRPNGRHPLDYQPNPMYTRLERQQETRGVAVLLQYDAWMRAHDGDRRGAAASCRALFHVARSLGDEPLIISQLVRFAEDAIACEAVERVLAQAELEPGDLKALQRLAEQEEQHPALEIAMRGERALVHAVFEGLKSGAVSLDDLEEKRARRGAWDALTAAATQERVRADHPVLLSWMNDAVAAARLPEAEQEAAFAAVEKRVQAEKPRAHIAAMLMPALSKIEQANRRIKARLRCLAAALALEQYRLKHQRWPESLERLTPDLLPAVPTDPYDGRPLRYRRTETGVAVYSVGPDRTDNDGRLGVNGEPGTDLGCRLFDVRPLIKAPKPRFGPPQPPDDDPDDPNAPPGAPPRALP
jgi:hypothetical protein